MWQSRVGNRRLIRRIFRSHCCVSSAVRITELLLRAGLMRASLMHDYPINLQVHMKASEPEGSNPKTRRVQLATRNFQEK